MRLIPIEIATVFNSEAQPGRHAPNETPYIQNLRLEQGVAIKDFGYSLVKRFNYDIIGLHVYDTNKALIVYSTGTGKGDYAGFEIWDMSLDTFTELTVENGYGFNPGLASRRYANIRFTNHYDTRISRDCLATFYNDGDHVSLPYKPYYPIGAKIRFHCSTGQALPTSTPSNLLEDTDYWIGPKTWTGQYYIYDTRGNALMNISTGRYTLTSNGSAWAEVETINTYTKDGADVTENTYCPGPATIITNGVTTPLIFFHQSTALLGLPSPHADDTVSTLYRGAQLKAELLASVKDVLYWAKLKYFDTAASKKIFNHRAIWSKVKNIGHYNDWDNYFDFTQGGDSITGLCSVGGQLYVGREKSIWTNAGGYEVFAPVQGDTGGTDSPDAMIDYNGALIYNSYGRVVVLGNPNHLTLPVHDLFANSGRSSFVRGCADGYNKIIYFSSGNILWAYDFKYGTWSQRVFKDVAEIKIVGIGAPRAESNARVWSDDANNNLSVAEESTLSDPVVIVGGTMLYRRNHIYNDVGVNGGQKTPGPTAIYETRLIPLDEALGYGKISGLVVEGDGSPWTVSAFYSDTIKKPVFPNFPLPIVFNNGVAQVDLDSGRCKYVAFQFRNTDTTHSKLSRLGILVSRCARR